MLRVRERECEIARLLIVELPSISCPIISIARLQGSRVVFRGGVDREKKIRENAALSERGGTLTAKMFFGFFSFDTLLASPPRFLRREPYLGERNPACARARALIASKNRKGFAKGSGRTAGL